MAAQGESGLDSKTAVGSLSNSRFTTLGEQIGTHKPHLYVEGTQLTAHHYGLHKNNNVQYHLVLSMFMISCEWSELPKLL